MDYKTNILNQKIETKEELLPEMPNLFFASISGDKIVFDATTYCKENGLDEIDYKVFMRMNKHYIESFSKSTGLKTSEIFYQNTDGHILIDHQLVFLYIAFVNPGMLMYFNGLLNDVISNGVAYSDGFIYSMALSRIPTEVFEEIVIERHNETTNEQQSDSDSGV